MKRMILSAVLAAAMLAGCDATGTGTSMSMGSAPYDAAFEHGRLVMARHFAIDSADERAGLIRSSPTPRDAAPESLFRDSPARHLATMQIRRADGDIQATVSVAVQRQTSAAQWQMQGATSGYDTVPDQTPAEVDAATTAEQNELWETLSYDRRLERRILRELYAALHEPADPAPDER